MFNIQDFGRIAISGFGALLLSVVMVSAAVGPARALEAAPIAYAQLLVAGQADG